MTNQHPITPPLELVVQWREKWDFYAGPFAVYIATQAAQWGADQELQACINFVYDNELCDPDFYNNLRNARRPKSLTLPLTLKDQALALLEIEHGLNVEDLDLLRRALKQLPND
jgi:hypothetical protein